MLGKEFRTGSLEDAADVSEYAVLGMLCDAVLGMLCGCSHLGDVLRLSRGLLIAQSQPPHHRCDCYEDPLPERCVSKICMSMYRSVCVGRVGRI